MDATVLAFAKQGAVVYTSDDGEPPRLSPDPEPVATHTLAEVEKDYILRVLQQTSGVIEGQNGAAKILDLHPNTLRSRMKKLQIKRTSHDIS